MRARSTGGACVALAALFVMMSVWSRTGPAAGQENPRRGDSNCDGMVDISDAVATLSWLFLDWHAPCCLDAADANGDLAVDMADAVYTLRYLYVGGPPFPATPVDCPPRAVLTWSRPATNADGTALTDLAGYKVYRGTRHRVYTSIRDVGDVTRYEVPYLPPGTYYYAVTAYDLAGNESAFSDEIRYTVPR